MKVADPTTVTPRRVASHAFDIAAEADLRLECLVVFGSVPRNENDTDSDVDIVLVSPDFGPDYYARSHPFQWQWDRETFGTPDIIPLTPDEFDQRSDDSGDIVHEAVETGQQYTRADIASPV